jgi:hypothetical protein
VSARLLRIALRLYPRWWRDRYGAEYEALLDQHGVDAATLADVARGALDARLAGRPASLERRRRTALAACLWAVVAVVVAVAGFQKMPEYDEFASAHHAPIAAGRGLIVAGVGVIALAVALAALVIGRALLDDLRRERRDEVVRPLVRAALASGAFVLAFALLALYAHRPPGPGPRAPRNLAALGVWLLFSAIVVCVAVANAGRVLRGVRIDEDGLRRAVACAWVSAGGMALTVVGMLVWGLALRVERPPVFGLRDGGLLSTPAPATWAVELVVGAGALALALAALSRASAGAASPPPRSAPSSRSSPPPAGRSSSSG